MIILFFSIYLSMGYKMNLNAHLRHKYKNKNKNRAHYKSQHTTMFQNKSRDKTKQDEEDDQEKPTEVVEFETAVIQGWIQFATFSSTNVPQKEDNIPFYINETYNEQIKHAINADDSDDLGLVNIPNKTSFWAVLMDGSIYILNSRRSVLTRVV